MGRIKKAATERHTSTLSPFVRDFVQRAIETPLHQLPAHLHSFPQQWPLPRGDLYHWIPLLDRFDHVLELFNKEYALNEGPQTQPFERRLLQKGDGYADSPCPSVGASQEELDTLAFSPEGDRELIEAVLHFTRVLLEHCGNRSLYASSTHVNDLLHTTSLTLLQQCLKLSLRLAQRYQVARYKNHHPSAQAVLLANHYNLNIENLHKMAMPFPKPYLSGSVAATIPVKGRDRTSQAAVFNPSDLVSIAKDPIAPSARGEMASVALTYYESAPPSSRPLSTDHAPEASPATPTPARRTSNLGPSRDRPSPDDRSVSANDISVTPVKSRESEGSASNSPKLFHISAIKVAALPAWELLRDALPTVPADMHYELLTRVRIAKAFASQEVSAQQVLEIRLLAIANLAYALTDSKFQDRVGTPDAEEPRRFHLASQLCDLLQPAGPKQTALTLQSETAVLITLEALTKTRHKASEVADALAITVNHGVLYYELRRVLSSLTVDEHAETRAELQEAEWRDTIFDLISSLLQSNAQARYGEKMVSAGIIGILVEALTLRTSRAEKFHERVLQFFDTFTNQIPNAFQTLAQVKGLDIIADLTSFEVDASLENARNGRGLPSEYKSKVVDYEIPFYQQSTLRQALKNTAHMFENNTGTHDRLLRNLIDTPQILGGLRKVIENAKIFGSNVWWSAVMIISHFIHNEPTSYQVIGEAGLSKSLLESVTGQIVPDDVPVTADVEPIGATEGIEAEANGEPIYPLVEGVLPVGDVMTALPNAFGAICLNEAGMRLFLASGAIVKYFDLFLSPAHVRAMEDEGQHASNIGQAFDELSRHHPSLKPHINAAVFNMLRRLKDLCNIMAKRKHHGAKLWERVDGKLRVAGGQGAMQGLSRAQYERALSGSHELRTGTDPVPIEDDGTEDEREYAPAIPFMSACFKFLDAYFHNNAMCNAFCDDAGVEILLDVAMCAANPYDYVAHPLFNKIAQVFKALCEARPQAVLPSIIRRTQWATTGLSQLRDCQSQTSAFARFIDLSGTTAAESGIPDVVDATSMAKSLVNTHLFTHILGRVLAPPPYTLRHGNQNNHLFSSLNFTEIYVDLIDKLSRLHATCVWEQLLVTSQLSDEQKRKTDPKPFIMRRVDANGVVEVAAEKHADSARDPTMNSKGDSTSTQRSHQDVRTEKNLKVIRYLVSQVPMGIESFFSSIGQAVVTKRMDANTKQHAMLVAEHLANALIWELDFRRNDPEDKSMGTRYLAAMLVKFSRVVLRNSLSMEPYGTKEALALVLTKFYSNGGFEKLNNYLDHFMQLLAHQKDQNNVEPHVRDAVHQILSFYGQVVRSKCITETTQTSAITVRDPNLPDFFTPAQFLVEIRDAILPAISKIWHSDTIEQLEDRDLRVVVDILRIVLKADGEDRALRRLQKASRRVHANKLEFKLHSKDGLDRLVNVLGFSNELSREALYRCRSSAPTSEAYARLRNDHREVPRFPIPDDPVPAESPAPAETDHGLSHPTVVSTVNGSGVEMSGASNRENREVPDPGMAQDPSDGRRTVAIDANGNAHLTLSSDNGLVSAEEDAHHGSLGNLPPGLTEDDLGSMIDSAVLAQFKSRAEDTKQLYATVDDLDEKRAEVRNDLVDRCLDVLSTQPTLTFELSDLIQAAVAKTGAGTNPRQEIGVTLVSSLMSLQAEEPSKEAGRKIHAYAHLVALILQDRDFFDSTLEELKEYFDNLVNWVRLEPDQKVEDAPWIEMILLIIENVLAEDEMPLEVEWEAPPADDPLKPMPVPPVPEPVVSQELRSELFDAMIDILPKVGKNATLALSVSRVLVIITRKRQLADRLSDKQPMSRVFLMIRQLAGAVDEKLQASVMLLLRHMVEDDDMIRQIMRTEIRVALENHRTARALETSSYCRSLSHLVHRNSQIFVEVTQEMLEIARFDGQTHRPQGLVLKKELPSGSDEQSLRGPGDDTSVDAQDQGVESFGALGSSESKPPTVRTTDGVINFLLRELTNYKDVEDKACSSSKDTLENAHVGDAAVSDVEMTDATSSSSASVASTTPPAALTGKASRSASFKPEEHAIYVYRCFILQCLAELVGSYNRTKVEFINFSRKLDSQPSTPSKPRAGTLHYLLQILLPVGTLEHRDDVAHRKKVATSNAATQLLVALCVKTPEQLTKNVRMIELGSTEFAEQETELTFVRKFVLDHALRVFNEVTKDQRESLDNRYSRLLSLGELFNRMLNDKADLQRSNTVAQGYYGAQQQMARLMIEKNFIATLTQALAELDLNFPNAKRAVKYVLSPLKQLTERGVTLSQTSDLSSTEGTGTSADEDEMSGSETDQTDDDDEREQTPDLFRGSSLGMFEARQHDDDEEEEDGESSGSDDEEEDYDMEDYEEGYDEEEVPDHGEVVSDDDEDDELGDMGGMGEIEGMPGDIEIEVDMGEDEDESGNDDGISDDDEDDDLDSDGEAEFADQMDEITGDDDNASMGEHEMLAEDEADWEDDGMDFDASGDGGSPHGGPLEHIAQVLGEDPSDHGDIDGIVRLDMGGGNEEEFFEDEMPPEDDDDEEDEVDFAEDIVYEPEMEDEEDEDPEGAWAWDGHPSPAIIRGAHHHHHHRHHHDLNHMLGMIGGGGDLRPAGAMRSHRATPNARDEDGMNPLLQRDAGTGRGGQRERDTNDMPARFTTRRAFGLPRGDHALPEILSHIGQAGPGGVININVDPGAMHGLAALPPVFGIQAGGRGVPRGMIDIDPNQPWRDQLIGSWPQVLPGSRINERGTVHNEEAQAVDFRPSSTVSRWHEEARMLFPGGKSADKSARVVSAVLRALIPAAMEARRIHEKEEAERKAAAEDAAEEAHKKEEAERAKREAQEKKEREEQEAKEREEAETRAREEAEQVAEHEGAEESTQMEGVQQASSAAPFAEAPAESARSNESSTERVTVTIRGRELDITDLGIDREYIEALPEEMREEVVMAQFQEQRSQQMESGEGPSEISREFLEALPRDIQQELLRSEQAERRRRDRDDARRRERDQGAQPQPEEMNNADFMAMLDPGLRQAVLMDADDAVLAALPDDLQAEARALFGDRRMPRPDRRGLERAGARIVNGNATARAEADEREPSRQRRPVAQLLSKSGVATLLRLMFVSLNHKSKTNLHSILSDVSKNTTNRAEVISILLSILQDGTADVNAVERSFAQLSLRAKQPAEDKKPSLTPLKRTNTGQASVIAPSTELSPLNIVQQCLGTLNALATDNERVKSFFLNEHETTTSQKMKITKKGKGRESKAAKYPINALLALLDRKLITENITVMETLASLLVQVTKPLQLLVKRAKEAQEGSNKPVSGDSGMTAENGARPQTSTSDVPMLEASAEGGSNAAETSAAPAEAQVKRDEDMVQSEAKKKKNPLAPDVPEENIRLVVNILAARECPSKTFSDTLDIIKNLSAVPGAKEVFGKELIRQAQELSQDLLTDLEELSKQIDSAQTGTDLQGMALASFSSAGSRQRKLLRVLVALDHLFDPKRTPTALISTSSGSELDQKLKDDILATFYESATFDNLWHSLSVCLTAIRERGNMVNVATILLPLIEALMVVCRNSALKDSSQTLKSPLDATVSTPPPEARMEGLFFKFTEEHRKILNELIRNNPKLMNGNLSVLAKNSKVLEFDNKRSYFSRKLHDRRAEVRVSHPSLQLSVRRDQVFLDSFKSLYYKTGNEIKYGKLNIRFHGEEGIDAGGVSREWFAAMARQMFNPDYALFNPVASDRTTFHPNNLSEVNPEHLLFFKFIGRIIGKALYENRVLDCHFSRAVYRKILGKNVSLKDMETLDLDYYKSLVWILENDITDVAFETFSVDVDKFGVTETIDLVPGGRDISVTEENKHDYVRLVVEHRLIKSVQQQIDHFLEGFHEIIPAELISIFNEQELELLISGLPDIDADDWKNNTDYTNYQPTSPQIQWFWRAVRSFDKEEKAKLLQFVTGTSKVPLNGFKELEGMNGFAKFNIHRDYSNKEKLPSSHTCFNQLDLPEYESYEHLRQQLYTAITAGSEYFGFA
ncbi:hypothetical protein DOTSEDRAFT_68195 [Dothistroma septosporum NZE10]|uniref:HECT-type E3 ubiquitin transferase n=1 Tax=Dothistroma septosporum (strain NZE10 / CBS 128990) TaxID=675120 RepID=N1Q3T4_DOTSN|nr:hypothetical protein DOTSEDRAFT_68195 [Dothistroma septosporum NZE10]